MPSHITLDLYYTIYVLCCLVDKLTAKHSYAYRHSSLKTMKEQKAYNLNTARTHSQWLWPLIKQYVRHTHTVSALIKVPLKNNSGPREGTFFRAKKNSFGVSGAPYLERRLLIGTNFRRC